MSGTAKKVQVTNDDMIPIVEIIDPFEYVSSSRPIVRLLIKRKDSKEFRKLMRTKHGGYMMNSDNN